MTTPLKIITKDMEGIQVVQIDGDINAIHEGEMRRYLEGVKRDIILDLQKVSYMDSVGIGVLVWFLSQQKNAGFHLKICHVNQTVKQVLELTKIKSFFKIYPTIESALLAMKDT